MRALWIVAGLLLLTLFAKNGAAQEPQLLTPVPGVRSNDDDRIENSRSVRFDPSLLSSRSENALQIDLFDGKTLEIISDELSFNQSAGGMMTGRALGFPLSEVAFAWDGNIAAGTINLGNGEIYRLRHVTKGTHAFEQLPSEYLPEGEPLYLTGDQARHANSNRFLNRDVATADQAQSEKITIDILVLYTEAAEEAMGGAEGTQNTLKLAEQESNSGFLNSLINMEFRIVHGHKIDFDESTYSFSDMLGSLTLKSDGVMDEVHALRDLYGADVVTLIVDRPLLCGKTYQNTGGYADFSPFAFVVVHQSCMTGYYSFSHEIGHVMGSQHNRTSAGSNPVFPFGYGYQDPTNKFRTIMAYNCPVSCTRINHWSNPAVSFQGGLPMGISASSAHGAHNSLSLAQMAPIVAQFRTSPIEANESIKINFQAESPAEDSDYFIDGGAEYGTRGNGLAYGWRNVANVSSGGSEQQPAELSYIAATSAPGELITWEILVPNGTYTVRLVSGDQTQTPQSLVLESQTVSRTDVEDPNNQNGNSITNFDEEVEVKVNDGKLTVKATSDQLMLNVIEITPLAKEGSGSPTTTTGVPFEDLKTAIYLPVVR